MRPDDATCGVLASLRPSTQHEFTLLAQLPEFYRDDPSRERLGAARDEVARASDAERALIQRRVVASLCANNGANNGANNDATGAKRRDEGASHAIAVAVALLALLALLALARL